MGHNYDLLGSTSTFCIFVCFLIVRTCLLIFKTVDCGKYEVCIEEEACVRGMQNICLLDPVCHSIKGKYHNKM